MKFFDAPDGAQLHVPELVQFFLARLGRKVTLEHQFAGHFFVGAKMSCQKKRLNMTEDEDKESSIKTAIIST